MKDPHVEWLRYRLVAPEDVHFTDPPPRLVEGPGFRGTLEDGLLVCGLQEHYGTVREARARVEPYLRAWEVHAGVAEGRPVVGFQFQDARRIDRDPSAGTLPPVPDDGSGREATSEASSSLLTREAYPGPPKGFAVSPDLECMWRRYVWYREGGCPVDGMARFCLTVAELRFGTAGRQGAVRVLRIEEEVLDTMAALSSPGGEGAVPGRRDTAEAGLPPGQERWLEKAVLALIRRMGEVDAGVRPATPLGMDALPPLA